MNALKNFVMARMMWDPSLNPSTLIESFLHGYYYSAAPHVRADVLDVCGRRSLFGMTVNEANASEVVLLHLAAQ